MKIKSISEAFSMMPITLSVVESPCEFNPKDSIKRIELEMINHGMDDEMNVYRGYNFEDELKFQYNSKSVHVHYF